MRSFDKFWFVCLLPTSWFFTVLKIILPFFQAANDCDLEPVAYEFFTQAFVLYEEEIAVTTKIIYLIGNYVDVITKCMLAVHIFLWAGLSPPMMHFCSDFF